MPKKCFPINVMVPKKAEVSVISMGNSIAIVCIKFSQGHQFCLFDALVDSHFVQQGPGVICIDLVWHDQQSWQLEVSLLFCISPSTQKLFVSTAGAPGVSGNDF